MCLIVASRNGVVPDLELLRNAHSGNHDGWGIMWSEGGTIRCAKGFKFKGMVNNVEKRAGTPFVLHLRYATHGFIDIDNCHPLKVTNDLWFAHNGVLRGIDTPDKTKSDSWHFAQELKCLVADYPWLGTRKHQKRLLRYVALECGRSNKIAFMRASGEIALVNEDLGTEYKGLWLSNDYAVPENRWVYDYNTESAVPSIKSLAARAIVGAMSECDYCCQPVFALYPFEGQKLCADCCQWARKEAHEWDRDSSVEAALEAEFTDIRQRHCYSEFAERGIAF